MGKRGVLTLILAFIAVFCAYAVHAEHTTSVSINPVELYETTTAIFNLRIINNGSNEMLGLDILEDKSNRSIINVSIAYKEFTPLASTIPSDWTRSLANDVISYANGKISSGFSGVIAIQAKANKVDANTTAVWIITTRDLNNNTVNNTVQILIINDTTPPDISNIFPYDGLFVKQGTNNLPAIINATDPETGVKQVNFNYNEDCVDNNNTKTVVLANNAGDMYEGAVDLSSYPDSIQVCFSFNAENNGGALAVYPGRLTIDGKAPNVTLLSPADNASMNSQSNFEFIATDNLAPNMTCELLIDEEVKFVLDVLNNIPAIISVVNATEGRHEWAVRCTDLAGWNATSETRKYILDRTPPQTVLTSPLRLVMKNGTNLNFNVTDNFELDGVVYSYNNFSTTNPNKEYVNITVNKSAYSAINETGFMISTVYWEEGEHDITIWEDDAAGNNRTQIYFIIIDDTAPLVNLLSPLNESNTDATFIFNASDNVDDLIDCTLYLNGTAITSTQVNTSENNNGSIQASLLPGTYEWMIKCRDDAGNDGPSESWNITIIDTTGPDITFNNVGVVLRGNNIVVNATIKDISGVNPASIYATMEDANNMTVNLTLQQEAGTDNYIGIYPTNSTFTLGNYIARVSAEDIFGNQNSNYSTYELTYAYVLTLTLAPNPANTGQQVTASGTVAMDDGQAVQDGTVVLTLPEATANATVSAGAYSNTFNAPASADNYIVTAEIRAPNGFLFGIFLPLDVQTPPPPGSPVPPGGNGPDTNNPVTGSSFLCGMNQCWEKNKGCVLCTTNKKECDSDNGCSGGKQCIDGSCVSTKECYSDNGCSGGKQCIDGKCKNTKECDKNSDCGNGRQCDNGKCVGQQDTMHYCTDGRCDNGETCSSCPEDCGVCKKGVGTAAGFFDLSKVSSSLLWLLLVLAIIAFVLLYLYEYGFPEVKPTQTMQASQPVSPVITRPKFRLFGRKDRMGIDRYMEKRNKP